jgi:hypothetical protein
MAAKTWELMERLTECRDLAKRVRRFAQTFTSGDDRERLQRCAEELEGQAADLERQTVAA